jgi:hypothetical protein
MFQEGSVFVDIALSEHAELTNYTEIDHYALMMTCVRVWHDMPQTIEEASICLGDMSRLQTALLTRRSARLREMCMRYKSIKDECVVFAKRAYLQANDEGQRSA